MNNLKRVIAVLLMLTISLGCLIGCSQGELREYTDSDLDDSASPNPQADDDSAAKESPEQPVEPDYTYAYEKYSPETVVMTIDGEEVSWNEFFYWINMIYGNYFVPEDDFDWDAECTYDPEKTNSEFVISQALENIKFFKVVDPKAKENNAKLSQEEMDNIQDEWDSYASYYGDEESFLKILDEIFLTKDIYMYYLEKSYLYPAVFNEMYGEDGEKCSDEEANDFIEDSGYYSVQHILLSTQSEETGEELSDEEKEAKRTEAETILQQITEAENLTETFQNLMDVNSEDPGLASYPEGYCFGPDDLEQLDPAFKDALLELEEMEYSGVVEGMFGYHILLRLPLTPETKVDFKDYVTMERFDMRYLAATKHFDSLIQSWAEEAEIEYKDDFEKLDLKDVFAK